MKKIIILKQIAALVLLLCLHPIIWAQEIKENTTGDPQVSEKHEDQTGSNQMTEEELELWNQAMKAFYYHKKEHFKSLPQSENDIIFLGNSITDNGEWAELFNNHHIKNRGIGGDDTDGVLERLHDITSGKPHKIFIKIGTNDLAYGKSVDYVVENYKKILRQIRQDTPHTHVYIQSILPTDDAFHTTRQNSDIMAINSTLKQMAGEENLTYIDLFSVFSTPTHKLNPEYSLDGLHLNGKGYLVWKEAIEKYVNP